MEIQQQDASESERRLLSRINAALRINYQLITRSDALKDPYEPGFVLPRYFLLLAELDEIDSVNQQLAGDLAAEHPKIAKALSLMNQKLDLITGAFYDAMVESMLPSPTRVNISESGLSFYARERIPPGTHLHLSLSHPDNAFHLAATARVITAAAIIMVCVFSAFVLGDSRELKVFGLGLATAVLVDATIVRMPDVRALVALYAAQCIAAGASAVFVVAVALDLLDLVGVDLDDALTAATASRRPRGVRER